MSLKLKAYYLKIATFTFIKDGLTPKTLGGFI